MISSSSKYYSQLICRSILGLFSWTAFTSLKHSVATMFSGRTAAFYGVLLCIQFHLPFYSSRALPNIFALIFVQFSFSMWLQVRRIKLFDHSCTIEIKMSTSWSGALSQCTLYYCIRYAHFSMRHVVVDGPHDISNAVVQRSKDKTWIVTYGIKLLLIFNI